jgi:hypothetical protein
LLQLIPLTPRTHNPVITKPASCTLDTGELTKKISWEVRHLSVGVFILPLAPAVIAAQSPVLLGSESGGLARSTRLVERSFDA